MSETSAHNISYATYVNIRFAQPPVGQLRFRARKTPPTFNTTVQDGVVPRNSTDFLTAISPVFGDALGTGGGSWGSEDCLFLDVKIPEGVQPGDDVPVLHCLYGGGVRSNRLAMALD